MVAGIRHRKRTPEPTLTAERWFLSVCYPKAYKRGAKSGSAGRVAVADGP